MESTSEREEPQKGIDIMKHWKESLFKVIKSYTIRKIRPFEFSGLPFNVKIFVKQRSSLKFASFGHKLKATCIQYMKLQKKLN